MPNLAADAAPAVPAAPAPPATQPAPLPVPTTPAAANPWALIFAGGIGSRFWPLSTPERPKQVLALLDERPLIAGTVARLAPLVPPERVLVLTSRDIAPAIHAAIPQVPATNLLVEPRPLGTAAALAWGAQEVERRAGAGAVLLGLHADLAAAFPDPFRALLASAAALAQEEGALVLIGVRPTRADEAFGYVHPGAPAAGGDPARPSHFVEKPAAAVAAHLVEAGYLWYAGILAAAAGTVLHALAAHTPEIAPGLDALRAGDAERFAALVASISVERGLLERVPATAVLPGEFGWDDVGTWACLRRARDLDDAGNGTSGQVHLVDASANVVHAEQGTVVLYGVSQLLVVSLGTLTFVTTLERARELRPLLDALPPGLRHHPTAP